MCEGDNMRAAAIIGGLLGWRRRLKAAKSSAALAILCGLILSWTSANAAPVTYELVGATATFGTGTDTLTGTFTVDFSLPNPLLAADITVAGSVDPGLYNIPLVAVPNSITSEVGFNQRLTLDFQDPLANAPDPLTHALIFLGADTNDIAISVTGDAVPTPVPAALSLFASGCAGLGLLGWRRKRKAQAVA
jgi:hypothetical protein